MASAGVFGRGRAIGAEADRAPGERLQSACLDIVNRGLLSTGQSPPASWRRKCRSFMHDRRIK